METKQKQKKTILKIQKTITRQMDWKRINTWQKYIDDNLVIISMLVHGMIRERIFAFIFRK